MNVSPVESASPSVHTEPAGYVGGGVGTAASRRSYEYENEYDEPAWSARRISTASATARSSRDAHMSASRCTRWSHVHLASSSSLASLCEHVGASSSPRIFLSSARLRRIAMLPMPNENCACAVVALPRST